MNTWSMSPCAANQTRGISSRVLIVDTAAAEESAPAVAEEAEPQEVNRRATWEVSRKGTQEMPQEVTY